MSKVSEIYGFNSYRLYISQRVKEQKKMGKAFSFQALAEKIGIQKSYLSKVLNNQAELSSDQLYLVECYFELEDEERDYLNLLWEFERSGLADRKRKILKKIKEIQKNKKGITENIEIAPSSEERKCDDEYYLDPYIQLTHLFFSIDKYQNSPKEIAKVLGFSKSRLECIIDKLIQMKIIVKENGRYLSIRPSLHLPKNSPLFSSWLRSIRLNSLQQAFNFSQKEDYQFSVVFSADEKAQEALQKEFLSFLQKAQDLVKKADSEQVFQINFDFLKWG